MKKKHIIYTLSTIPLAITISNVSDSDAFFRLDSFITKNKTVSDIVEIKDENLLKAINNQLGRGEVMDSVTVADMESLTVLNAQERNIVSIEGLEYAINLINLNLGKNSIQNILPLNNLINLKTLYLNNNQILDITALSNLTSLNTLRIDWNNISDITVLSSLINLSSLNIGANQISDITSVSNLRKLNSLQFGTNKVVDIEPLRNLINLSFLGCDNNQISDITPLNGLTNLKTLYLYDNKILDISSLSNLTNLTTLHLNSNQISDITILSSLINLKELYLNNNQISDVLSISNLSSLTTLHLNNNQISDISILSSLTNLKDLRIGNNQVLEVLVLSGLINLNTLYLNNNQISDISPLSNLINLETLNLGNNQILNIAPLSNLINLETLNLGNNQISNISSLSNLTNLNTLYLYGNQISDIFPLSNLTNLNTLHLYSNQISDISTLNNLTNLNTLHLHNNQILNIAPLSNLSNLNDLRLNNNQISDISTLNNLTNLNTLHLQDNQILSVSPLYNLTNLRTLYLHSNRISDISSIRNLKNLNTLNLSNQKPIIEAGDFKSETNELDISINNPIIGLFDKVSNVINISNSGVYEKGNLKWNNVPLGNHTRKFNFLENITIGSTSTTFGGIATINFNVVDGGAPESDHTSDFDNSDFGIYTTVTANDLGVGVDYLMHKGVRQSLPYRFKYDIYNNSNNLVEVYDLVGNKAEYQVKLKDSDIPTIEEGLDALVNKSDSGKEDISYFRKIINDLDESMNKDLLQNRLNDIYPKTLTLDRELATSNMDVYIKSENILQMALDTNSITFEDFSGVEDIIRENAVNVSINSSLPYQLNAYLPVEIQNADKTNIMDKSILNIKENSENIYQVFANTTDKLVLKDNCPAGNDLVHGVDIKLSGGIAYEKDVYKTTIKFEAEQK